MVEKALLGVLISGSGTNLQAIIDAIEEKRLPAELRVVISNKAEAYGLTRARKHGIATRVIAHRDFATREEYDTRLVEELRAHQVNLVALAGFNRIVTRVLLGAFPDRVLNIHPALLPSFPGLHAQRQALEYGVKISGATVHFVDEQTDHGPIIVQAAVPVLPGDTEESLSQRILEQEHVIYPLALKLVIEGKVRLDGRRAIVEGGAGELASLVNPPPARQDAAGS